MEEIENKIDLSNKNLKTINLNSLNCTNISTLSLNNNDLIEIPSIIFKSLTSLKEFYIDHNKLESIPNEIGELINLEHLTLHFNLLKTIPSSFGKLKNLKHLRLDENELEYLPEELSNCNSLTVFHFPGKKHSKMVKLIDSMDKLENLIDVGINSQLEYFPPSFANCKKLQLIWSDEQPKFKNLPIEIFNEGIESINSFFNKN